MRAVIVYESMFGATRLVAEAVAEALAKSGDVEVVRAGDADEVDLAGADLLVVGAPTHAHGLPRAMTRRGAPDYVRRSKGGLTLEPGAESDGGVREWLEATSDGTGLAAAFDTRVTGPALVMGQASRPIAKSLAQRGFEIVAAPESFLVDKASHLLPSEIERAVAWGATLAERVSLRTSRSTS